MKFTQQDVDRLLGLGDQFLEDWGAHEGEGTPEFNEREAEWKAVRPLLTTAPVMRDLLERFAGNAERIIDRTDGAAWLAEVRALLSVIDGKEER